MGLVIVRRIIQAVPTLFFLTLFSFGLMHVVPGGPAEIMLGNNATPQLVAQINRSLGLSKPLYIQYFIWLGHMLRGNFGYAYTYHQSVTSLIFENLPRTLLLVLVAIILSHLISIWLGVAQAVRQQTVVDHAITTATYVFYCMPVFWLGIIMVSTFAVHLRWFPSGGVTNPLLQQPSVGSYVYHMVLPVVVLVIGTVAGWTRYLRGSMVETLHQDYIRTARAKGLSEPRVLYVHALRNSVIPLITLVGMSLPGLFSGALIIEMIFNYPGMGLLFWDAAQQRDYPVLMAIVVMVGVLTIVGNLLADILYAVVDPRIRHSG
jgi:peptide/nickel transport system permease protein